MAKVTTILLNRVFALKLLESEYAVYSPTAADGNGN